MAKVHQFPRPIEACEPEEISPLELVEMEQTLTDALAILEENPHIKDTDFLNMIWLIEQLPEKDKNVILKTGRIFHRIEAITGRSLADLISDSLDEMELALKRKKPKKNIKKK